MLCLRIMAMHATSWKGMLYVCKQFIFLSFFFDYMHSPVGRLTLVANDAALVGVLWENDDPARVRFAPGVQSEGHFILRQAAEQLHTYFDRKLTSFTVPLQLYGTPFQQSVWQELAKIPFGETRTYQQLANQLGNSRAVRAVGAANGKNPLSIILPCHRVIGSSGALTGFAGGLPAKSYLLALEGVRQEQQLPLFV